MERVGLWGGQGVVGGAYVGCDDDVAANVLYEFGERGGWWGLFSVACFGDTTRFAVNVRFGGRGA